jgi:hypothetical protein
MRFLQLSLAMALGGRGMPAVDDLFHMLYNKTSKHVDVHV